MNDEHNLSGAGATAKVSSTEDGKTKVEVEVDSYADALSVADSLTRQRQRSLVGLDKVNAMDAHISPRLRQTGEITFRAVGIAFGLILGVVVAISSGDAAQLIFPDAPMYPWVLWLFGALTVPGGIWAADELMKLLKDETDNKEQRVRITAFALVVIAILAFDSLGVLTARITHTSGAATEIRRNAITAETLEGNIQRAQTRIKFAEVPSVSSDVLFSRVEAELEAPTRTGRPVGTVGELMEMCAVNNQEYCFPYQNRFARIKYMQSEYQAARDAEQVIPTLQDQIETWQKELAALEVNGDGDVDKMFCRDSADENCEVDSRFQRTAFISVGQVFILAIIWLLILEDRHKQIALRRKAKLAEMRDV